MSIHIITDSASDIAGSERENLTVIPMTITFGETEYQDGVSLNHTQFYEMLIESSVLPVTSQIPPFRFEEAMKKALGNDDEVIVITLSSKLSGTWQSAMIAAENFPGQVQVIDSENVTVGEHILVEYAFRMIDQGAEAAEIAKQGGRISSAAALAGSLLSIKPVIAIQNGEVAILGKARGSRQANNLIVEQIHAAGGIDFSMPYFLGYTGLSRDLIQKYIEDNASLWENETDHLPVNSVGGTIGTHTGPGAIAVAFVAREG